MGNIPFHFTSSRVCPRHDALSVHFATSSYALPARGWQVQNILKDLHIKDVSVEIIHNPNTNISKGCCFTCFQSAADLTQLYHAHLIVMEGAEITIEKVEWARASAPHLNANRDQGPNWAPTEESTNP